MHLNASSITKHEQVEVKHPRAGTIKVDRNLAPLLLRLWELDVDTLMSCERERGDWVWIMFPDSYTLERFLSLVANNLEETPQQRVQNSVYYRMTHRGPRGCWKYDAPPIDYANLDDEVMACKEAADFDVSVSVRFPCRDHRRVLRAVQRAQQQMQGSGTY